jgi:serine/threonine-protein kinase
MMLSLNTLPYEKWYFRVAFYAGSFLTVGSLSGLITYFVMSMVISVEVPDIRGRSLPAAVDMLDNAGLSIEVGAEVFDLYVPAGHIMEQDIPPGTRVRGRSEVVVTMSKGPEVKVIPSVVGLTLGKARKAFIGEGLDIIRVVRVHSDRAKKGVVIAQRPAPEEWTGETITIVTSAGPRAVVYYCPRFRGMYKEDALLLASELRLKTVLKGRDRGDFIVEQRPEPGTVMGVGSTVHLTAGGG